MPISRVFLLELFYFFAQGAAQAIYDLAGNHIILKLWQGVSTSPINAMHAGNLNARDSVEMVFKFFSKKVTELAPFWRFK